MEEAKENLCNKCNSMKFGLPYYLLYLAKCSSYLVCVCVCVCLCVCEWFMLWSLKFYVHVITEKSFQLFFLLPIFWQ